MSLSKANTVDRMLALQEPVRLLSKMLLWVASSPKTLKDNSKAETAAIPVLLVARPKVLIRRRRYGMCHIQDGSFAAYHTRDLGTIVL